MILIGTFPFGSTVEKVVQRDRGPKRVFVLGVYASAVYARWLDDDGATLANALAVASEPDVFWRGENLDEIVASIPVPPGAGRLLPAADNLNGPSGVALDAQFLAPLGLARSDAWLCDLVPHSCKTDRQAMGLKRTYDKRAAKLGLPAYDWPSLPEHLTDGGRRAEIAAEMVEATPELLITLGDQPLEWFATFFGSKSKLSAYGETPEEYGQFHEILVGKRTMVLLPLAHPRQVARVGSYSAQWGGLHEYWARYVAPDLLIDTSS